MGGALQREDEEERRRDIRQIPPTRAANAVTSSKSNADLRTFSNWTHLKRGRYLPDPCTRGVLCKSEEWEH